MNGEQSHRRRMPSRSTSGRSLTRSSSRSRGTDDDDRKARKKAKKSKKRKREKEKKEKKSKRKKGKRDRDSQKQVLLSEAEQKSRKEGKKAAKMIAMFGYSNEENPFGDSSLTKKFVWEKKIKRDLELNKKDTKKSSKEKERRRLQEIKLARLKREEREKEREELENRKEEETRQRERDMYADWFEKEEQFHAKQRKKRSKIRFQQQRERLIDHLCKVPLLHDEYQEIEAEMEAYQIHTFDKGYHEFALGSSLRCKDPITLIRALDAAHLREVSLELEDRTESEKNKVPSTSKADSPASTTGRDPASFPFSFYELLLEDVKYRISVLNEFNARVSMQKNVKKDLEDLIQGRSLKELESLAKETNPMNKTRHGREGVDVDYWQEVYEGVKAAKRRLLIEQKLRTVWKTRARILKKLNITVEDSFEDFIDTGQKSVKASPDNASETTALALSDGTSDDKKIDTIIKNEILNEDEELMPARDEVSTSRVPKDDRASLKKPRYFNKVKVGFMWNKYNRTHYDEDNPPPKTVKGYKFNIFYPALKHSNQAPRFYLEGADTEEFAILRFKTGAPYQDVAFKILNKEWEKNPWHGFKCVFEKGILQLHFNFKRVVYRK